MKKRKQRKFKKSFYSDDELDNSTDSSDSELDINGSYGKTVRYKDKPRGNGHLYKKSKPDVESDDINIFLVLIFICLLVFIFTSLVYGGPGYFLTIQASPVTERNFHWTANFLIYSIGAVSRFVVAVVLSCCCFCLTAAITYCDSLKPGVTPPTPVSPCKIRQASGHTFHLSYTMSLLNSAAVFVYCMWWSSKSTTIV